MGQGEPHAAELGQADPEAVGDMAGHVEMRLRVSVEQHRSRVGRPQRRRHGGDHGHGDDRVQLRPAGRGDDGVDSDLAVPGELTRARHQRATGDVDGHVDISSRPLVSRAPGELPRHGQIGVDAVVVTTRRAELYPVIAVAVVAAVSATLWSAHTGSMLLYGDAQAHLNVARHVTDSLRVGLAQLGAACGSPCPTCSSCPWSRFAPCGTVARPAPSSAASRSSTPRCGSTRWWRTSQAARWAPGSRSPCSASISTCSTCRAPHSPSPC